MDWANTTARPDDKSYILVFGIIILDIWPYKCETAITEELGTSKTGFFEYIFKTILN